MPGRARDPYQTLGVSSRASDDEVRTAYHRLVQLHHPDHNGGSPESARSFEEVQEAYARIRELRRQGSRRAQPRPPARDPDGDARLADLERQVREARAARERAQQAAREAARDAAARAGRSQTGPRRASDEELGYVTTDDSFSKILSDARDELAERLSGAREHPAAQRVADLIDELEGLVWRKPSERGRD